MLDIVRRYQYTLFTRQAARATDVEKTLDFLIGAADRLDHAFLVHGSGYRQGLPNRDAGYG